MLRLGSYPLRGKTILLRVDFNVPISNKRILDNAKIKATLPTIEFLLKKKCKIIIATHLGRPQGRDIQLKTDPLAKELGKLLKKKVEKVDDCIGIREFGEITLLENLRFYKEEESNDLNFAQALAHMADVYVNDAFGLYRQHASVDAITRFLPSMPGLLMEKEVTQLGKALVPERPSVWLMGGAKLNKVDLILNALKVADKILIGGALPFSFMKAMGKPVGSSLYTTDSVDAARKILKKRATSKIILPVDYVVKGKVQEHIGPGECALDIGPKSIDLFLKELKGSKTVVWNGPMGKYEDTRYAKATKTIGKALQRSKALTIAGGGETSDVVKKYKLQLNHVSTGGGASLYFLSGKKLPALVALQKSYHKFK